MNRSENLFPLRAVPLPCVAERRDRLLSFAAKHHDHTARVVVTGPSARDHTQMVYDPVRRVVVLHGGGLDQAATETWTYDGRAWTRASFTGPSRRYAKMAFDTRTKAVQLYGGFAEQPSNELWQLGPSAWRRIAP